MHEIIKKIIRARVQFGRGMSWFNDLRNMIMFAIFFKVFGFPDKITIIVSVFAALVIFTIGRLDIKKVKSMQYEQEYVTELNPILRKINKLANKNKR